MDKLVSVIMPVYNGEAFVKEAIESVLNQQYSCLELLVVDDGSIDGTADIVSKISAIDKRLTYYYQNNSGGCSVPRNYGLSKASGEYITFFDADDIMLPQKIKQQVACLQRYKDVHLVFCDYQNFNNDGTTERTHFESCTQLRKLFDNNIGICADGILILDTMSATRLLAKENFTISNSPLYRKSVIDMLGGFNTSLKASEDWLFHMQALSRFTSAVLPVVGFNRRLHGNNMSSNRQKMLEFRAKTREMGISAVSDPQTRSILREQSAMYWFELSRTIIRDGKSGGLSAFTNGLRVHRKLSLDCLKTIAKLLLQG